MIDAIVLDIAQSVSNRNDVHKPNNKFTSLNVYFLYQFPCRPAQQFFVLSRSYCR